MFKNHTALALAKIVKDQQLALERAYQAIADLSAGRPVDFTEDTNDDNIEEEEFIEEISSDHIGEAIKTK